MKEKIIRGSIVVSAVILILAGIYHGGFQDVRNKAVRICYECIGIG